MPSGIKTDFFSFLNQGKSAVWSHLLSYQEAEDCNENSKTTDPKMLTPGMMLQFYVLF